MIRFWSSAAAHAGLIPGVFLIAESGVHSREDALRMMNAGADALLVGTALMGEPKRLWELNQI